MYKPGPTSHETKVKQLRQFIIEVICVNYAISNLSYNGIAHTQRKHSARVIQDKYGSGCAELFRIIFTRWTRGGRTKSGIVYNTQWVITPKHTIAIVKLIETMDENSTAKDWVKTLKEQGFEETIRGREWDEKGTLIYEKILTKAENAELVKAKRKLREITSLVDQESASLVQ